MRFKTALVWGRFLLLAQWRKMRALSDDFNEGLNMVPVVALVGRCVGKSTLFNRRPRKDALVADFPESDS
ncbi:hypothetical protein KCP76_02360 [Salmonella enterica subsp. enterica serovar Weltevreden]|nr:hypothetical protein KCP76_02360 [Salmonella enterica subsp. enterica serovar Weltevreden]